MNYTFAQLAEELDTTIDDLCAVAQIELDIDDYNLETETVSSVGRETLVAHFHGGTDPQ